jgi:hypothetical protein
MDLQLQSAHTTSHGNYEKPPLLLADDSVGLTRAKIFLFSAKEVSIISKGKDSLSSVLADVPPIRGARRTNGEAPPTF